MRSKYDVLINYFLDIICVAYSPIGAPNRPDFFKEVSHPVLLEDDVIEAIAKKHNATAAQVCRVTKRGQGAGGRAQVARGPQGPRDLIIPNASRSGGPHIVDQQ